MNAMRRFLLPLAALIALPAVVALLAAAVQWNWESGGTNFAAIAWLTFAAMVIAIPACVFVMKQFARAQMKEVVTVLQDAVPTATLGDTRGDLLQQLFRQVELAGAQRPACPIGQQLRRKHAVARCVFDLQAGLSGGDARIGLTGEHEIHRFHRPQFRKLERRHIRRFEHLLHALDHCPRLRIVAGPHDADGHERLHRHPQIDVRTRARDSVRPLDP